MIILLLHLLRLLPVLCGGHRQLALENLALRHQLAGGWPIFASSPSECQNAEAYFDWTGTRLIFQSTRPPFGCDQIFTMRDTGSDVRLHSTGEGRTTCSFFFPDGKRCIYASTYLGGVACPPPPDRSRGYVWPIYPTYEIFSADLDGGH